MTDERSDAARNEAETIAGTVPAMLEKLAERLGASMGASAVFGAPVQEGGRTVIPVAQAMIGTGAGGGGPAEGEEGSGMGAGGGAMTRPLGYIEVSSSGAAFVPLQRPWADVKLVLAYTALALVVGRLLVRLVRG